MPFHVLNKDSDTDSDDDFSDIFDDGGFNFTMLCSAIQRSDLARVQSFLSRGVNPNKRGPSGIPLLNVACQTGDARIVRALLNWRADMSGVNKVGGTPLMEAAAFGHLPLVKFLAGIGANPETKSRKGNTALDIARREGQYSVVGFLEGLKLEGCHPGVTCDKSGMMPTSWDSGTRCLSTCTRTMTCARPSTRSCRHPGNHFRRRCSVVSRPRLSASHFQKAKRRMWIC
jgi:hypothetical protein